jgi:hypothetical protein
VKEGNFYFSSFHGGSFLYALDVVHIRSLSSNDCIKQPLAILGLNELKNALLLTESKAFLNPE